MCKKRERVVGDMALLDKACVPDQNFVSSNRVCQKFPLAENAQLIPPPQFSRQPAHRDDEQQQQVCCGTFGVLFSVIFTSNIPRREYTVVFLFKGAENGFKET